jgi:dGTPase
MDFSDDVAYSIHDFEDAIVEGFLKLDQLDNHEAEIVAEIERWNGHAIATNDLASALDRLQANPYWLHNWSDSPNELGQLKNLTSSVIGSFVSRTTGATFEDNQGSAFARYAADVVVPQEVAAEIAIFKGLVSYFLMSTDERKPYYEMQRTLLTELADVLLKSNGKYLDSFSAIAWAKASSMEEQYRVVVDQIACYTDEAADRMHQALIGSTRSFF